MLDYHESEREREREREREGGGEKIREKEKAKKEKEKGKKDEKERERGRGELTCAAGGHLQADAVEVRVAVLQSVLAEQLVDDLAAGRGVPDAHGAVLQVGTDAARVQTQGGLPEGVAVVTIRQVSEMRDVSRHRWDKHWRIGRPVTALSPSVATPQRGVIFTLCVVKTRRLFYRLNDHNWHLLRANSQTHSFQSGPLFTLCLMRT